MNNLMIKEVNFHDDKLLAIRDDNLDKIYVGASYVCNGIGLSRKKADYEIERIKTDMVLKKGTRKIGVPSNGGSQESICIELDYLPLWLAKINPNIIKDEKAQNKLIDYQLKAKDVLAKAFIKSYNTPKTFSEALLLASNLQEKLEFQKPKVEMFDTLMESEGLMNFKQIADSFNACGRNTLMKILREERILCSRKYNKNLPYSQYSKNGYFEVKVTPRRTNNGVEKFCTTLCTNKSLKLIQKILKKKGLLETTQIASI